MAPRASLRAVSPTRGTASLAPHFDVTAHIVLDDFGKAGRVYRETGEEDTTLGSVVDDLLTGQFNNPVRVVAFNISEGWSRDVSEDIAREVLRRLAGRRPSPPVRASSLKHTSTGTNCCVPKAALRKRPDWSLQILDENEKLIITLKTPGDVRKMLWGGTIPIKDDVGPYRGNAR